MYLKRLELVGFKSFQKRIALDFGPGITAVVGPNGSGKSNLAEAIRWVLGEQNARSLRGSRMEDIIFSGTRDRRPVSLAEVTITLDNQSGRLPVEFREVGVTRRVDRGGASDYLLNRTVCRLRDVQELFYDTGVGKENYSFIGQGQIDRLLDARPEERRFLFEEAAGVAGLKARRQQALRYLDRAETRLLRMEDIVRELEERLGPLGEQADRAERHARLTRERRQWELALLATALARAKAELHEALAERSRWAGLRENLERSLEQGEGQLTSYRDQVEAMEETIDELNRDLLEVGQRRERSESEARLVAEKLSNWEREADRLRREREEAEKRLETWLGEHDEETGRLDAVQERLDEERHATAGAEAELAQLEEDRLKLEATRREAAETRQRLENEVHQAEEQRQRVADEFMRGELHREHLKARLAEVADAAATRQDEAARAESEMQRLREAHAGLNERVLEMTRQIEDRRAALRTAEQEREQHRHEISRLASRRQLLSEMQESYEGYYQGVRTVMQGKAAGEASYEAIEGVVSDLIRVPARLEEAVGVALGASLQDIVTSTAAGAQSAIEALKRSRGGRATFLPLDAIRPSEPATRDRQLASQAGAVGWAAELVETEPRYRAVIQHLLGRILVAENLSMARQLARSGGFRYRVVTVEGEVIHPGGAMTGGQTKGRQGSDFLRRNREIEELEKREKKAGALASEAERRCEQAAGLVAELEHQLRERRTEVARQERELLQAEASLKELQRSRRGLLEERERLEQELQQATAGHEDRQEQRKQSDAHVAEQRRLVQQVQNQWDRLTRELETLGQRREELQNRVTERRITLSSLEQETRSLVGWQEKLASQRRELERSIEERKRAEERLQAEQPALEERQEQIRQQAGELAEQQAELESRLSLRVEARRELQAALRQAEERLKGLRQQYEQAVRTEQQSEFRHERAQGTLEQVRERAWERYELGVDELPEPTPSLDEEEARRTVRRLSRQIAELEPVNPGAIAEYREVSERHGRLSRQARDIRQAAGELRNLADQLAQRMEARFQETLRAIRREFRGVFQQLFGGGEADLVLVESADEADEPLTAGVEVMAQPPGKKLTQMSLLSGGERALTAIALLFAVLKVRPSPFCVLDEIDAALDDANVERFAGFLRLMAKETQFIVITHQKGTMEVADRLFGVTMQESGVSSLVSVRLADLVDEPA